MYLAQLAVAAVIAVVVLAVGEVQERGGSVLGPVLASLAIVQCALGAILPQSLARSGSKGSALAATLLAGVLLATPGWFLMLALITGQGAWPLLLLGIALMCGYALGFLLTGRFARRVAAVANDARSE